jgi:16S rRNA (uracil1498-N3)-methyltransferase
MPSFFVASEAVTPPTVRITGPLLRHLRESLRLHPGDTLTVTDDRSLRYRTEVLEVTAKHLIGRILDTVTAPAKTSPSLILAQALLKGEKMDWVIQKATELGVDRIVPIHATHSVVKLHTDRTEHQLARWQRIALEAAQQSERWSVPHIDEPAKISELLTCYGTTRTSRIMLAERSTGFSLQTIALPTEPQNNVLLLIGPEGGWAKEELRLAEDQGYAAITLGPRILRAETAAIAVISILQSRTGELG